MLAPFQILAIPYRFDYAHRLYCVFHRADCDQWQFVSGGGEDDESPADAAVREICEECSIEDVKLLPLKSVCSIPTNVFAEKYLRNWPADTYVVPEYAFGFLCDADIHLSEEHDDYAWLSYEAACERLSWDSNRTALYELHKRLEAKP